MELSIEALREARLFFLTEAGEEAVGVVKFSHAKIFLYAASAANKFFCVFQPSPSPVKKNGLSLTNISWVRPTVPYRLPVFSGLINICKWSPNGHRRLFFVRHLSEGDDG